MTKKKITFGVIVGGLSVAASSLSGLIIYPLLLKNLSEVTAGLWLFYTSLTIIITLGQAGLAPIVMRRAASAISDGSSSVLADFFALIKKSYFIVAIIVVLLSILLYSTYVHWVLMDNPELFNDGLIAWIFFVTGNLINIYFSKNFYIINGFGEVGWDKVNQILIITTTITGYFVVLNLGYGLIGLSIVFFMASIFSALISIKLLNKFAPKGMLLNNGTVTNIQLVGIFKDGGEILVLNLVSILVLNKDIFLVERFQGLTIIPFYSALSRIQGIIITISLLIPQMLYPFISQNFVKGNYILARKLYLQGVFLSLLVALFISTVVYLLAGIIIPLWLGEGNYLGNEILLLMLLMGIILIHHNAHASAVISTSENSFVFPAIVNATLSVPFSIIGMVMYGIEGMLIGNIIATIFPSIYIVKYSINFFNKISNYKPD